MVFLHGLLDRCPQLAKRLSNLRREIVFEGLFQRLHQSLANDIEVLSQDPIACVASSEIIEVGRMLVEILDCLVHMLDHALTVLDQAQAVVEVGLILEREQLQGFWGDRKDIPEEQNSLILQALVHLHHFLPSFPAEVDLLRAEGAG